jgi:hypothetical protein
MPLNSPDATLPCTLLASGFAECDSNFDSLSVASDGCVYYTLCTHNVDTHARIYRYDPKTDEAPDCLGILGEIVGEAGQKSIPQGKSHSQYYEHDGKLYLATHYGYYKPSSNKEEPAETPEGYKPYPGGHFLEYDMATGQFRDLAKAVEGEGIITMTMDAARGRLYGLTWPRGHFVYYDLEDAELKDLGPVSRGGETGDGEDYFCLCRTLGVHPADGSVYFTNPDGEVKRYNYSTDSVESTDVSFKLDIFGHWDPHEPGHQGYNWRKAYWHEAHGKFYAIHGKSGFLFSFDPASGRVDVIERLVPDQLRRSGAYEPFRYGYMSFAMGADNDTFYYLTAATDHQADGRVVPEVLHLTTYRLSTGEYADHGALQLDDGRHPTMTHSIAVHPAGRIYTVPWIEKPDADPNERVKQQVDLISLANPLA